MKGFYKYFIALLLCSFQTISAQPVQFEAKVSQTTVALNESIEVEFSMNKDGDNFNPPNFDGFQIIGGPNQMVNYSWINGKKSFQKSFSYSLVPTKKGTLTIGSARVEIENQIYQTNPISITVTDAVKKDISKPNANSSASSAGQVFNGIHLVAEVSDSNPFENQPITIVYKVYFKKGVNVQGWSGNKIPKYKDVWVHEIEVKELKLEEVIYKGEEFYSAVVKKDVLMPQDSGNIELEPLDLDIHVDVFTGRRDFFGFQETEVINKIFSTGKKTIKVKPLPLLGKPDDFSGAVGKFKFNVTPSTTKLKEGEPLSLKVEISGRGNMQLFSLPTPEISGSFDVYDPEYREKINVGNYGLQGNKSNTYTIIPQYKGEYSIYPMRFSYFDLDTKTYKTITSDEIPILVLEGDTPALTDDGSVENPISEEEFFRDIKKETNFIMPKSSEYWNTTLFYILSLLPLLIIPLFVEIVKRIRKRSGDKTGLRLKENSRLAKKYLGEAKKNIRNKDIFYEALERSLFNFLKAKLNIETTDMSNEKIKEILENKGISKESIDAFMELKTACDFARYTPATQDNMNRDFDRAIDVIAQLENQFK